MCLHRFGAVPYRFGTVLRVSDHFEVSPGRVSGRARSREALFPTALGYCKGCKDLTREGIFFHLVHDGDPGDPSVIIITSESFFRVGLVLIGAVMIGSVSLLQRPQAPCQLLLCGAGGIGHGGVTFFQKKVV